MTDAAIITFCGQPAKVVCDSYCAKAWGISQRPRVQLSANVDDYEYLADSELGVAPRDPKTYEGGEGKPENYTEFPNKWCVRECERCAMSKPGESHLPLVPPDFSKRIRNLPTIESP